MTALSAENTWTPTKKVLQNTGFDLIIYGTFEGTVQVEASYDEITWHPLDSFTEAGSYTGHPTRTMFVRAGFPTGGYTSGTAQVLLG